MKNYQEFFIKFPLKARLGLYLLGFAVVILFSLSYFNLTIGADYHKTIQSLPNLKKKVIEAQIEIASLSNIEKNIKALDEKLQLALLRLPKKKELNTLLTSISEIAETSGLQVVNYSAKPEEKIDAVTEIQMFFELQGHFVELEKFYLKLAELPRLVKIKNQIINVVNDDTAKPTLNISCLLVAYQFDN